MTATAPPTSCIINHEYIHRGQRSVRPPQPQPAALHLVNNQCFFLVAAAAAAAAAAAEKGCAEEEGGGRLLPGLSVCRLGTGNSPKDQTAKATCFQTALRSTPLFKIAGNRRIPFHFRRRRQTPPLSLLWIMRHVPDRR